MKSSDIENYYYYYFGEKKKKKKERMMNFYFQLKFEKLFFENLDRDTLMEKNSDFDDLKSSNY